MSKNPKSNPNKNQFKKNKTGASSPESLTYDVESTKYSRGGREREQHKPHVSMGTSNISSTYVVTICSTPLYVTQHHPSDPTTYAFHFKHVNRLGINRCLPSPNSPHSLKPWTTSMSFLRFVSRKHRVSTRCILTTSMF